jgi:hypothetical protein
MCFENKAQRYIKISSGKQNGQTARALRVTDIKLFIRNMAFNAF